uniref:Glycoside hydrolase family 5 protein n=1 Tax=Mycena chlorophos TaxID=658473 RepID=A0ABQ0LFJ1_MYCCL|nr:glycoside hydrolase family 5 protein [Mycena chlorophos]
MSLLKVDGTKIVNEAGEEVILRGAGLGGWMNMENFITGLSVALTRRPPQQASGYPGCEFQIREALATSIGQEKSDFFFDKFLEYFFMDADAKFFSTLGLNCIRLPFNYHHFEDDMNPRVLKESGFKHLDRVIELCAAHNIYTILDLHTVPGGQNTGWHSDHGGHLANFWKHKDFQDRTVWLWEQLAAHYKGNKWIAGYNPLNEPTDPSHSQFLAFYRRVYKVIRAADPEHIIFFDGNTWAQDFSAFGDVYKEWDNTAYSIHDYSPFGFPAAHEPYVGAPEQRARMQRTYEAKRAWLDERGLCVWNGEWGPVYARKQYEGERTDEINKVRFKVLEDQLDMYSKDRLSWSIWLYKDIGFQGMVYVSQSTPYMKLFAEFLVKKHRLATDSWGADDTHVRAVYAPLIEHIKTEVPEKYWDIYPHPAYRLGDRAALLARNILVSEFLVREWADHFVGKTEEELDEIAASFRFEVCEKRNELNRVLMENASASAAAR